MSKTIHQMPEAPTGRERSCSGKARLSDRRAAWEGHAAGMDVMTLAGKVAQLIDEKGLEVKAEDLTQFEGVGDAKATLILAAIEFARRRSSPRARRS